MGAGFDVYPNPETAPVKIAAAGTVTTTLLTERRSAEAQPTMYIRVVMLGGAVDPTFKLQAGTGDPVVVPSTEGIWDLPGGPFHGNYVADSQLIPEANGVYLIKVLLFLGAPATWKLSITNNDVADRSFTFVAGDSDDHSKQPWIDMDTTINYNLLITESGPINLRVFNNGTGPLTTLTGVLAGADAASFTFTPPPGGLPILPNHNLDVPVAVTAFAAPKSASASLTVNSDDSTAKVAAGHNHAVALSATVGKLEIAFMLDASGSMAFGPNGEHEIGIDNNSTRWGFVKSATNATLAVLKNFATNKGDFAIGMYPDITPFPADPAAAYAGPFPVPSPSANDIEISGGKMVPISDANINDAKGHLDAHFTRENGAATPMGAGIGRAIGTTAGSFGYFSNTPDGNNLNRRWLLLMTDGNHNSGPPDPSDFYPGGALPSFQAKHVKVSALGYGNKVAPLAPVNEVLLTEIVNKANGDSSAYHFAQADATPDVTTKFIKGLLFTGLSLDTIADPGGVLSVGNPTVTRAIEVTPYDRKVGFLVSWTTFNQNRLRVQVQTPLGEVIEVAGGGAVVDTQPRFRMLTFDQAFLVNERDPARPRYGTWKLVITLSSAVDGQTGVEPYDYQVLTDTRLKLRPRLNQSRYAAGDAIELSALLTLDGQNVTGAAVTLTRDLPGTGFYNWLAAGKLSDAEFNRVREQQHGNPDLDSLGIKLIGLGGKGLTFPGFTNSDQIKMEDSDGTGVYRATTLKTNVPGTYRFLMTAVGTLPDGTQFRREQEVSLEVVTRPDPLATRFDVVYARVTVAGVTMNQATLTVRPLDRFGNVVLIDPAVDRSLLFKTSAGHFDGPIVDHHDGSYTQVLLYGLDDHPSVTVTVGDDEAVAPTPVAPLAKLHFVDKVYGFQPGHELTLGANLHHDATACLGDVSARLAPSFVALGGAGSLVVGISGHYIVGSGQDDVTVFVQPSATPRAYSVEAGRADGHGWVEIGRSNGGTRSFSLRSCGLEYANAVRVIDRSNRVREADGTPSAAPGVSVAAVGIKQIEAGDGDLDDRLLAWLKQLGHRLFHH